MASEAEERRARIRKRRERVGLILIVGMFAIMGFERLVNSGWLGGP